MSATPDAPSATASACHRSRGIRALLLTLAPATAIAPPLTSYARLTAWPWVLVAAVSVALLVGGLRHRPGRRAARVAATAALYVWLAGVLVAQADAPEAGFVALLAAVVATAYIWPADRLRRHALRQGAADARQDLVLASAVALVFGGEGGLAVALGVAPGVPVGSPVTPFALSLLYALPVGLLRGHLMRGDRIHRAAVAAAGLAAALPAVGFALDRAGVALEPAPLAPLAPLIVLALVARDRWRRRPAEIAGPVEPGLIEAVLAHPSRILVLSFLVICAGGALVLGLPVASATGEALSWLDAAFTAVSATCVTGLIVVDTPTAFTPMGQLVVLGLIQVGGLGIMVFSAAAVVLLGRRLSLSHERAAVDIVGASGRAGLGRALRAIFAVTFATEAIAAVLLFFAFLAHGDDVGAAAWRGLFTAVSAFCNAGFALQTDSLVPYAQSPFVLSTIAVTIVVGGLGPSVVTAVLTWPRSAQRSLHARLVLWTTLCLLAGPALLITVLEWDGTLAGMSVGDKVVNGVFQSVTLRTAGFNSIDLAQVHPATWTTMILTMFVGGSPGSTAGGAKTTTIAVVVLAVLAVVRGRERVDIFGRTLPLVTVLRATAVATVGVLSCCAALVAVQLTQSMALDVALFEVVSALATVGLSTGGTGQLDEVGKVIVMVCMFAGRVGPLTLFVFLTSHGTPAAAHRYPEETVPIG